MGEPLEYESIFEKTFVENVEYILNEHIVKKVNEEIFAVNDEEKVISEICEYMQKHTAYYQLNFSTLKEEEEGDNFEDLDESEYSYNQIMELIQSPIQHLIKEGAITVNKKD